MNKICTSVEQSKKLIELGIDVNTADMYWWYSGRKYYVESMDDDDFHKETDIPAWSLTALLGLMPIVNENTYKMCGTLDGGAIVSHDELTCAMFQEDNPIDAAFEMVCWLKENNKI